ncbi:MAG TPA: M23 family metallopeptidase [Solirubrobacteraceae bacterium]|jgi:murein DD-endopeptidase MepM/ murein hydrolase activator NlpD
MAGGFSPGQRETAQDLTEAPSYGHAGPLARQALLEAGIVESNLTDNPGGEGNLDSRGVLQQRASQGWGTVAQELNPTTAAEMFLQHAIPLERQYRDAGSLAQAVQRSAFPERYGEHAGQASSLLKLLGAGQTGGGVAGAPARPGAGPGGGVERTPAQIEDLMSLIDSLGQKGGSSLSTEGFMPTRPTELGQAPPKVQAPPEEPGVSPASLLGLIGKIGEDASTGEAPSAVGLPARAGSAAPASSSSGGYVNPLPGFKLSRTDMGVDATAAPGTPIRALGNAKILGIQPDWYAGQPYLYYELLDGPQKGQVQYVAEQIAPTVKAGDVVKAGQTIAHYASSGTGIETGIGTHGWQTLAQQEGRTGDSTHGNAPAGLRERKILEALGAH